MRLLFALCVTLLVLVLAAEPLEDSCECECCYEVDAGRVECVSKATTTFQSHTCTNCNVSACIKKFPGQCGAKGASVVADCIERTAWYLRIIPIIFVMATVALLFYGFFIKTFDGYNPIPGIGDGADHNLTNPAFSAAPYASIGNSPFQPRQPYAVRRPSPLSQSVPLESAGMADFVSPMSRKIISPAKYHQRNSVVESVPLAYQPTQYGAVRVIEPISPNNSSSIDLPLTFTGGPQPHPVLTASRTDVQFLDASEHTRLDPVPESGPLETTVATGKATNNGAFAGVSNNVSKDFSQDSSSVSKGVDS